MVTVLEVETLFWEESQTQKLAEKELTETSVSFTDSEFPSVELLDITSDSELISDGVV